MASEAFVDSVEELITRHLLIEATIRVAEVTTGKIERNGDVEAIINRVIRGALELARKQIAARKVGTMTFDQALQMVVAGKMVTRPGWPILRALRDWELGPDSEGYFCYQGRLFEDWELDNLEGGVSGGGLPYNPTDEDRNATDWMEYQPPIDLRVDLYD